MDSGACVAYLLTLCYKWICIPSEVGYFPITLPQNWELGCFLYFCHTRVVVNSAVIDDISCW